MPNADLKQAITQTTAEINRLKSQIEAEPDPRRRKKLEKKKKELQILQLWQMDQCGGWE